MLGCWVDQKYFLSGAIHTLFGAVTTIWLCEAIEFPHKTITFETHRRALFKFLNPNMQLTIYARFLHLYVRNIRLESPSAWETPDGEHEHNTTHRHNNDLEDDMSEEFDIPEQGLSKEEGLNLAAKNLCVVFICSERTTGKKYILN